MVGCTFLSIKFYLILTKTHIFSTTVIAILSGHHLLPIIWLSWPRQSLVSALSRQVESQSVSAVIDSRPTLWRRCSFSSAVSTMISFFARWRDALTEVAREKTDQEEHTDPQGSWDDILEENGEECDLGNDDEEVVDLFMIE